MDELINKIPLGLEKIVDFRTVGMAPPNRIIFGFRSAEQVGKEASGIANGAALIVSDKILEKIGVVEQARASLVSAGFSVEIFTDVEPEPHLETADALYEKCLEGDFSILVGLGGGSVMDITKIVAQAAGRKRPPRDYALDKVKPDAKGLPMILLPTTAGTGSEVSAYTVLCIGENKRFLLDPYYYPDIAIIDPLLTVSMPAHVTASTGIDAVSHAIEGMMHVNSNPFTEALGMAGIEMAAKYMRRAVADSRDLEARYYMSMAATLSMMAMSTSGGLYAHSASFVITKYKPTAHGVGCGLGLPYLMDFNLPVITPKLARMAAAMGESTWMYSETQAAKAAVHAVVSLMKDSGLPVMLREHEGIKENDLDEMAKIMIEMYPRPTNPRVMTMKDSLHYWRSMWDGSM